MEVTITLSPSAASALAEQILKALTPRFEEAVKRTTALNTASATQLTVKEVAGQLKSCEKTILNLLKCGKLAGTNVSNGTAKNRWVISQRAVDKFLANRTI